MQTNIDTLRTGRERRVREEREAWGGGTGRGKEGGRERGKGGVVRGKVNLAQVIWVQVIVAFFGSRVEGEGQEEGGRGTGSVRSEGAGMGGRKGDRENNTTTCTESLGRNYVPVIRKRGQQPC